MSEHADPAKPLDELFEANELEQFEEDDNQAGRFIGKMLSFFFLYTVVVMAAAVWWTLSALEK